MRNLSIIFIFMFCASSGFAQRVDISEAARSMNNGTYNSFLFELPDVVKKEAEDNWKDFMGDFKAKTKYDRKNKIWFSDDAQMPRLSDNTVDVYARIIEDSNPKRQTTVIVWFDLGGAYLSSETDKTKGAYAHEILLEYGMTTSKHHAEAIVKDQEKELDDLERDLKKLRSDNADYRKSIEKAKETILEMEKKIEINEQDQGKKEEEIGQQKEAVAGAKEYAKKFN